MSDSSAPAGERPSLGIVVPVYNEAATIESALREIASVARRCPGRTVVIAVDDGSADESPDAIGRLAADGLVEATRHAANRGYGAALRTGTERAAALDLDYVAFIDSDLTNPPADLIRLAELAAAGHPYVKASRFVPGGGMEGVSRSRRAVSVVGNVIARGLFGTRVRDVTNGFRAVRTDLVHSWRVRETGFAVIVEELDWALRCGVEPVEVPSVLRSRGEGQRPSAFAYTPSQLWSYLRYPLRAFARRLLGRV